MDFNVILISGLIIIILNIIAKSKNAINVEIKFLGFHIKINSKKNK